MAENFKNMPPDVLATKVSAFARKRLSKPLAKAAEAGEDPTIVMFALLECIQMILEGNFDDHEDAVKHFETLADGFVKD